MDFTATSNLAPRYSDVRADLSPIVRGNLATWLCDHEDTVDDFSGKPFEWAVFSINTGRVHGMGRGNAPAYDPTSTLRTVRMTNVDYR